MVTKIISDSESLEIYRKTLERTTAAKYASELAAATPDQTLAIQLRIKREADAEFQLYLTKRSWWGCFNIF